MSSGSSLEFKLPIICGHRGASGYAPENTLAAFRMAQQMGAGWVEFDVQLSADNVPILLHDDTLARTTNGGDIRPTSLTLTELKRLDAGSWLSPEFAGEPLPTLDEVLDEFGGSLGLNIEIKSTPGFEADNGIEQLIAEAVARRNLYDGVLVSSFDPTRLITLHKIDPKVRLGALYTGRPSDYPPEFDPFDLVRMSGAVAFHPHHLAVTPPVMERARAEGLAVNVWTVNTAEDMERAIDLGVDMIITNYPDRLKTILLEKDS